MCHRATCKNCSKPTWRGCGKHVEQALAGVPKSQRCSCREDSLTTEASSRVAKGMFARLRGR